VGLLGRRGAALGLVLFVLLGSSCAGRRVLRLENRVLRAENAELLVRNHSLERRLPDAEDFSWEPDLDVIAAWLDRAGFVHERRPDEPIIRLEWQGEYTRFEVILQHFVQDQVLFVATDEYLTLADAPDSRGVVLLLVKLAALNYELIIGKFQLEPTRGEILLSAELHLGDGLGYETFVNTLQRLLKTADAKHPELSKAAGGEGL
jgi:hypothetical protein